MRWWWLCAWFVLFWGAVFCGVPQAGAAQAASSEVGDLRLERGEDGLYLSANLQFELPELAEDALQKGIPMFFVADAKVLRDRKKMKAKVQALSMEAKASAALPAGTRVERDIAYGADPAQRYDKVVITVDDPQQVAATINAVVGARRGARPRCARA